MSSSSVVAVFITKAGHHWVTDRRNKNKVNSRPCGQCFGITDLNLHGCDLQEATSQYITKTLVNKPKKELQRDYE